MYTIKHYFPGSTGKDMISIRIKVGKHVVSLPVFDIDKDTITIVQLINGRLISLRLPYTAIRNPSTQLLRLLKIKGFIN